MLSHPSTSPSRWPIPSRSLAVYEMQGRYLSGPTPRLPAGIMRQAPTTSSRPPVMPGNIRALTCTISARPLRSRFSPEKDWTVSVTSSKLLPRLRDLPPTPGPVHVRRQEKTGNRKEQFRVLKTEDQVLPPVQTISPYVFFSRRIEQDPTMIDIASATTAIPGQRGIGGGSFSGGRKVISALA